MDQRVRHKREFDAVFGNRKRLFGKHFFVCHYSSDQKWPRLGVIVGKKNIRLAVDRNRVRRIAREGFRLLSNQLAALDVVFVAKKSAGTADKEELRQCIDQLLKRLTKQAE